MTHDVRPVDLPLLDPLTPEQTAYAAHLHARLRAHRGDWGHWEGGKPGPDGALTAHRVVLAPIATETHDWLLSSGVLPVFDWVAWPAKRDLVRGDAAALEPDLARALLTALVLQDHSCDGSLLGAFRHGIITDLLGVIGSDPSPAAPDLDEELHPRVLEPI